MYTKLFRSITSSSVWIEDSDTIKLWVYLLAEADQKGYVFGSLVTVADRCKISIDKARAILEKFSAPDPYSSDTARNPENKGRRIEVVNGGWRVINLEYYRDLQDADVRRAQKTSAQRKWRRSKSINVDQRRSKSISEVTSEADTTTEADAEENRNPAPAAQVPPSSKRIWRGVKSTTIPVLQMLDRMLRARDSALALPDKLGVRTTTALNTAMASLPGDLEPHRVTYAVYWAFFDDWHADKIRDVPSFIASLRAIISGSADTWKSLKDDLSFMNPVSEVVP